MRIRIFQADKGDCLLLSSQDGAGQWTHVLVDGGMKRSYQAHVADQLAHLEAADGQPRLDLVVVSHVDEDHIAGVLQLADDSVDWKVYDYRRSQAEGDPALLARVEAERPEVSRPPPMASIWHNAFHEQLADNEGPVGDLLAAMAPWFGRAPLDSLREAGQRMASIETSKTQAHALSRRIGAGQLGVPLNQPAEGRLMMVDSPAEPVAVGPLRFSVIGPFPDDLERLRNEWQAWLRTADNTLRRLRDEAQRIERDLGSDLGSAELQRLALHQRAMAALVADQQVLVDLAIASGLDPATAQQLGDAGEVTFPNRASLMLLCEEGAGEQPLRVVLTGDGHHDAILRGLGNIGLLPEDDALRVDVLKIPHHGSEHNADQAFFRRLVADHYLVCANGAHHNPDLRIVQALLDSRLSPDPALRSAHPGAGAPFTLWFSTRSDQPGLTASARQHLREVALLVEAQRAAHSGRFEVRWSSGDFIDLLLEPPVAVAPGRVYIRAVQPDPVGADAGQEWVELHNDGGQAVDLDGHHLEDRQGGRHALAGRLEAGATRRVILPAGSPVRLANSGDAVLLVRGTTVLHQVAYQRAGSGQILEFPPP